MRIAIRAGPEKATRSAALAQGMAETEPSAEILLLTSGCPELGIDGVKQVELGESGFSSWDMEATEGAFDKADIVVLDNAADEKFQHAIRPKAGLMVVVEDEPIRGKYSADCVVNPNVNAHLFDYSNAGAELLLGAEFFALGREFDPFQDAGRETPERCRKIAVHLGADRDGACLGIIKTLKALEERCVFTLCLPKGYRHGEALASEIGLDGRFIVADQGPRRLAQADVAICSRHTLNELLFFRLPFLVPSGGALSEYAAKSELGLVLEGQGESQIRSLIEDMPRRERMSARMSDMVDGLGRYRLSEEIFRIYSER